MSLFAPRTDQQDCSLYSIPLWRPVDERGGHKPTDSARARMICPRPVIQRQAEEEHRVPSVPNGRAFPLSKAGSPIRHCRQPRVSFISNQMAQSQPMASLSCPWRKAYRQTIYPSLLRRCHTGGDIFRLRLQGWERPQAVRKLVYHAPPPGRWLYPWSRNNSRPGWPR